MKRLAIFLTAMAFIAGMLSCASPVVDELVQYSLTVWSTEGGAVTMPGEGSFAYVQGTVVSLVAEANEGYRFLNWTGNVGTIASIDAASTTITLNSDCSIKANFEPTPPGQYTLTISSTIGGSVIAPGEGSFDYTAGTVVDLVAEPEEGYEFAEWIGDVSSIADIKAASTAVTMNAHCTLIASFGSPTYESLDYFPITEGHGVRYRVTDDWDDTPLNVDVWAVSQYFETGKPDDLDFVFTLVKEGTGGGYFAPSSLGGQASCCWAGEDFTAFYAGYPVGNQGNFYGDFCIPRIFRCGDEWTWVGRQYTVEHIGQQTIGDVEFDDCVKVAIDSSVSDDAYMRGTGYFILARDVGIVELVFNRANGAALSYKYLEHAQLERHAISGTVHKGGVPVGGLVVGISNGNWGVHSVTDSNGAFSIQAYGPDVVLRMWYDKDSDDICDFDDPGYPKEQAVNNIGSDVADLSIDVSDS